MSDTLARSGEAFVARYRGLRGRLPGDAALRDRAAAAFGTLGLPHARQEEWRYTSLRKLAETRFADPAPAQASDHVPLALSRLPHSDAPRFVFVDGRLRPDLSTAPTQAAVSAGGPGVAASTMARFERDAFAALNLMLSEDGARIRVPAGVDAGTLQLVSLSSGSAPEADAAHGESAPQEAGAFHPRHFIELGEGARLTLIEMSAGQGRYLHAPMLEITVGPRAHLVHLRLQDEDEAAFHVGLIYVDVAARGNYDSFLLNLGAQLSRSQVHACLRGEAATAQLNCAQLLRGSQHGDFTTTLAHDAPGGRSRQTVRNVLDGAARGVFQGRINVDRLAQKTDGYQMNHALLLSPHAEIDSKPELRINADDVKCSHGATVGELDADQLFYLRSRGVPHDQARAMLIRGFLSESLADIEDASHRALFEQAVEHWWQRGAAA